MTHHSQERTMWFVLFCPFYERDTPISDEISEVILPIIHLVSFFVRVASYCVVVELGVKHQSFPFFPTRWYPAPIVLV